METIRRIAKAYYAYAPAEVRKQADDFNKWMMSECGGTIGETEFRKVTERPFPLMSNSGFFQMLKEDKNTKTLSKDDVITMFYIIMSGRPFCYRCGHFILEVYFTCLACHKPGSASYTICLACFENKKINHHECKGDQFMDCYTWLYGMQAQNSSAMGSQERQPRPSGASASQERHGGHASSRSNALVNRGDSNLSNNERDESKVLSHASSSSDATAHGDLNLSNNERDESKVLSHASSSSDATAHGDPNLSYASSSSNATVHEDPNLQSNNQQDKSKVSTGRPSSNAQPTLAMVPARQGIQWSDVIGFSNLAIAAANLIVSHCSIL